MGELVVSPAISLSPVGGNALAAVHSCPARRGADCFAPALPRATSASLAPGNASLTSYTLATRRPKLS